VPWKRIGLADRDLATRVAGVLWLSAAATTLLGLALPGSDVERLWVVRVIVAFGVAWGTLLLAAPPWPRTPMAAVHVSTVFGICAGAAIVPVTGGADSPRSTTCGSSSSTRPSSARRARQSPTGWPAPSSTPCR
jgi:hypothetical protein